MTMEKTNLVDALDGLSLEDLAANKDSRWSELASELMVARQERAAKAERDRLIEETYEAVADGTFSFDDPNVLDGLRQSVLADRERDAARFLAAQSARYTAAHGDETARLKMDGEREALTAVEAFLANSGDPLLDNAAYRRHLAEQGETARARAFALNRVSESDFGLAAAEADVDATYRAFIEATG